MVQAEAPDDVVEAGLEQGEEGGTGRPLLAGGLSDIALELPLQDTEVVAKLLLLAEAILVVRPTGAATGAVLSRRVGADKGRFGGQAGQDDAQGAANLNARSTITGHQWLLSEIRKGSR